MFNQVFKEFIASLNVNQVRYLVVGGYAVALHGYPRFTKDLDIWVDNSPENARAVVKALAQFGNGGSDRLVGRQSRNGGCKIPNQIFISSAKNPQQPVCWWLVGKTRRILHTIQTRRKRKLLGVLFWFQDTNIENHETRD